MTTHIIPKSYNAEYIAKRISAMTRRDEYAHVEVNNTTLNLTLTPETDTTQQVTITPQKEPTTTPAHEALESLEALIEDIANRRGI